MKKIIAIVLLFSLFNLYLPVWAEFVFPDSITKYENEIEEILSPCMSLLDEAAEKSSSKKYVQFSECGLKQDMSSLDPQAQKDLKNILYSLYILHAFDLHKITKDKKYLNKAYKISKKAIKNEMDNVDVLKASILIFALKGSPKNISKAYSQMCEANRDECTAFFDEYGEIYNQGQVQRKEKMKWVKNAGIVLLVVAAVFGAAYAGSSAANKKKKNIHCTTLGNSTYCNEY